jgi:hypothetical protein
MEHRMELNQSSIVATSWDSHGLFGAIGGSRIQVFAGRFRLG